jgi:COMPASS component SWD3
MHLPYVAIAFHGEHRRAISALSFAPNRGEDGIECDSPILIASASADATVKVWNIPEALIEEAQASQQCAGVSEKGGWWCSSSAPRVTLVGHTRGINDVCWSRSCRRYIATASDDKTLRLWDSATGLELVEFRGHTSFVFACKFNPQSNLLVSGSFDETVKLWDVRSGECISTLPAHSEPVTSVDFNRDGTCVASASHDGLIRIWDVFSGECLKTLYAQGNPPVSCLSYSPNGRYILASTLDSKLRLWDTTAKYHPKVEWSLDEHFDPNLPFRKRLTGLKCAKIYSGHVNTKFCTFAAFCVASPKRQLIACGSEDGNVYLYGLHSRAIEQVLQGHKRTPNNAAALHALSPQLGPDTSVTTSPPIHPSADSASPSTSTAEFHDVTLPSSATIGGAPISNSSSLALAVAAHPTREILATSGRIHDGALSVWVPASHTDTQDAEDKTTSMESTSSPNKRVCIHSLQTH